MGNLVNYDGELSVRTADINTAKMHWNSVISTKNVKFMCLDVVQNWLIHESFYLINSVAYCQDDEKMLDAAVQFARALKGVINGCIGVLDGWVVKIKKPSHLDGVEKPIFFCQFFFYSQKGYFAVNVKVIVNKNKWILFPSIKSRGAEHDSTAFKSSALYKWLI